MARVDLEIRPINADDPDEVRAFQRVYEQAERVYLPDASVFTLDDAIAVLTRPSKGSRTLSFGAFEHGEMVGEGMIMAKLTDNLRGAQLFAWVPPTHRGRGIGSAIAALLVDTCLDMGRGILRTSVRYPADSPAGHPYRRFAERHGFTQANVEIERRLALPVPTDLLDTLAAEATAHHLGYRLLTIIGPIPAEYAQGYCDVQNRLMLDAPTGDLVYEAGRRTPEILADQDEELILGQRTRVTVLALDPEGEIAALTCAAVAEGVSHVDQWSTIVRPKDRGHRLGSAVKARQVRELQTRFPDRTFVTTTNADTNAHMIAINESLGFRTYAEWADYQRIAPGYESV
jgi:GNAT superfamily N-acetyltransferase